METQQAALVPAAAEAASCSAALEAAKTELRLLRERADSRGKEVGALAAQLAKAKADRDAKASELAKITADIQAAGPRRAAAEAEVRRLEEEVVGAELCRCGRATTC